MTGASPAEPPPLGPASTGPASTGPGGIRVGLAYPQTELGGGPDAVRAVCDPLESMGADHLLAYDHVLGASHADRTPPLRQGGYDEHDPFHDPFVLFAYLAGRTTTLRFISGVLVLPQRQTALVAKQAADLALLSGNRLELGVGVGWNFVEYEALGADFAHRGAVADEQIPLLRRLWTEPLVDFSGDFHRIDRAAIVPRPTQPVPVLVGGFGPPALRRAAAMGDGFVFAGSIDTVSAQWADLQQRLVDAGRDPATFTAAYTVLSTRGPDDVASKIERWAELGGTVASVVTMGLGLDSPEAHLDYFGAVLGRA